MGQWTSLQGDEFLIEGIFDASFRLPHVPIGADYEVRIGFSMSSRRGVIQFYIDKDICDIPTDMRMDEANKNRIGWFSDYVDNDLNKQERISEEDIKSKENAMRNRGYMKGPESVLCETGKTFRMSSNSMRRILITNYDLTPKKEGYWIRVKNVTEGSTGQEEYNMDYIEIVPKSIYDNIANPEDRD